MKQGAFQIRFPCQNIDCVDAQLSVGMLSDFISAYLCVSEIFNHAQIQNSFQTVQICDVCHVFLSRSQRYKITAEQILRNSASYFLPQLICFRTVFPPAYCGKETFRLHDAENTLRIHPDAFFLQKHRNAPVSAAVCLFFLYLSDFPGQFTVVILSGRFQKTVVILSGNTGYCAELPDVSESFSADSPDRLVSFFFEAAARSIPSSFASSS